MEGSFSQKVWELATSIPAGRVTTYGILAKAAGGGSMAARSITSILGKAPNQGAIPYHRIIYAGGKIWFTPEREDGRRELYANENIEVSPKGIVQNLEEVLYYFDE
jgi:methylated-DNA-protein-cysteine methyltransferase-like protein